MSISIKNSSSQPLSLGQTFIGGDEDCSAWSTVNINFKADTVCAMTIEFSSNALDWDFTTTYTIEANQPYSNSINILAKFMHIIVVNKGTTGQTLLRLQSILRKNNVDSVNEKNIAFGIDKNNVPRGIKTDLDGNLQVEVRKIPTVTVDSMPANMDIRNLSNTKDDILLFGNDGTTNKKILTDTNGTLLTKDISVSMAYGNLDINSKSIQIGTTRAIRIHNIAVFNRSGAERFLRLYNSAKAAVGDTPQMVFALQPLSNCIVNYSVPIEFTTALCVRATTGPMDLNINSNSPSTNDVIMTLSYSQ